MPSVPSVCSLSRWPGAFGGRCVRGTSRGLRYELMEFLRSPNRSVHFFKSTTCLPSFFLCRKWSYHVDFHAAAPAILHFARSWSQGWTHDRWNTRSTWRVSGNPAFDSCTYVVASCYLSYLVFVFFASSSCGPGAAALGATSQSTGGVPRSLAGTGETQDPRDPRRQRAGNDSEMMEMEIVRLSLFQKIGV